MLVVHGTESSPYARRVRIVAAEIGVDCTLLDTRSPEGQARLRACTPIWKLPVAELDGEVVLDSHSITELLLLRHGAARLAPFAVDDVEARNVVHVIDGALDALINTFYLGKDGVDPATVPYVARQRQRAGSAMSWLEARLKGGTLTGHQTLGLPEIALGTALGWMVFRDTYPVGQHPALQAFLDVIERRPSFASTRPAG